MCTNCISSGRPGIWIEENGLALGIGLAGTLAACIVTEHPCWGRYSGKLEKTAGCALLTDYVDDPAGWSVFGVIQMGAAMRGKTPGFSI
jgi:hypothetical protein